MSKENEDADRFFDEVLEMEKEEKYRREEIFKFAFQEDAQGNPTVTSAFEELLLDKDPLLNALKKVIEKRETHKKVSEEKDLSSLKIETAKKIQEMLVNEELDDFDGEIEKYQKGVQSLKARDTFSCFDSSSDKVSSEDLKDEPVLFKPNFLSKGEIHILAGKAGCGKSYLATQMACALSTREPLLGMHSTEKQKVAYLSFEDSNGRLIKRLRNVGWTDTPGLVLYNNLSPLIICSAGKAQVTPVGHALVKDLHAKDPDTIIFDTYSQAFLHDDGDNKGSQQIGNWLKEQFGDKTVLIVHHVRKAEEFKKSEEITIDAIRGASALVGYARSAFFLAGVDHQYQLKALKSNYGEPFPNYKMAMYLEKIVEHVDGRQVFRGFRAREEYISTARQKFEEAKL